MVSWHVIQKENGSGTSVFGTVCGTAVSVLTSKRSTAIPVTHLVYALINYHRRVIMLHHRWYTTHSNA